MIVPQVLQIWILQALNGSSSGNMCAYDRAGIIDVILHSLDDAFESVAHVNANALVPIFEGEDVDATLDPIRSIGELCCFNLIPKLRLIGKENGAFLSQMAHARGKGAIPGAIVVVEGPHSATEPNPSEVGGCCSKGSKDKQT